MLGKPFYNGHIRKFLAAFASLFSDIKIATINENGYIVHATTVPIKYAGLDKTLIQDTPDRQPYNEIFPRMSFEFIGIGMNSDARINQHNVIQGIRSPAPYTIETALYILARDMNDVFQIIEQIIPFFNPTLTISMMNTPIKNQSIDVPITLTAVSLDDSYEGEESDPRRIEVTLNFSSTINFYSNVGSNYENALINFITTNYDPSDPSSCTPPKNQNWNEKANRIEKVIINSYVDKYGIDINESRLPDSVVTVQATLKEIADFDAKQGI
jgi:hypothetical protein